jgi:hypothetical protein
VSHVRDRHHDGAAGREELQGRAKCGIGVNEVLKNIPEDERIKLPSGEEVGESRRVEIRLNNLVKVNARLGSSLRINLDPGDGTPLCCEGLAEKARGTTDIEHSAILFNQLEHKRMGRVSGRGIYGIEVVLRHAEGLLRRRTMLGYARQDGRPSAEIRQAENTRDAPVNT